jgi:hypothetical protein
VAADDRPSQVGFSRVVDLATQTALILKERQLFMTNKSVKELTIKLSAEQTAQIKQATGEVVTELTINVGGPNGEFPPGPTARDYPPGPTATDFPPGPTAIPYPPGPSVAGFPPGPSRQ